MFSSPLSSLLYSLYIFLGTRDPSLYLVVSSIGVNRFSPLKDTNIWTHYNALLVGTWHMPWAIWGCQCSGSPEIFHSSSPGPIPIVPTPTQSNPMQNIIKIMAATTVLFKSSIFTCVKLIFCIDQCNHYNHDPRRDNQHPDSRDPEPSPYESTVFS